MSLLWKSKANKEVVKVEDIEDTEEDVEDSPEFKLLELIEIVTKDTQLSVKELNNKVAKLIDPIAIISELKAENAALKAELREEKIYNRELINKLIEFKSHTPAATHTRPVTLGASSTNSNTAGPKGKLP